MSELKIFNEADGVEALLQSQDRSIISAELEAVGVRFESWPTDQSLEPGDAPEKVLVAYQSEVDRIVAEEGYLSMDVVSLSCDHPQKAELRQKFLFEHTHREDEVRFFAAGRGNFSLHIADRVYECLCEAGDFISVPHGTPHWFDMGPEPSFVAIRLFNNPEGWVAQATGSDIADRFSRLEP